MFTHKLKAALMAFLSLILIGACSEKAADPVQGGSKPEAMQKKAALPDGVEMVEYDTPPAPVDGFGSIGRNLKYPESARKAGTEGRVLIWARISKDGSVTKTVVGTSLTMDCDTAAREAIEAVKWSPAVRDENPLDVWVAVPIDFRLN